MVDWSVHKHRSVRETRRHYENYAETKITSAFAQFFFFFIIIFRVAFIVVTPFSSLVSDVQTINFCKIFNKLTNNMVFFQRIWFIEDRIASYSVHRTPYSSEHWHILNWIGTDCTDCKTAKLCWHYIMNCAALNIHGLLAGNSTCWQIAMIMKINHTHYIIVIVIVCHLDNQCIWFCSLSHLPSRLFCPSSVLSDCGFFFYCTLHRRHTGTILLSTVDYVLHAIYKKQVNPLEWRRVSVLLLLLLFLHHIPLSVWERNVHIHRNSIIISCSDSFVRHMPSTSVDKVQLVLFEKKCDRCRDTAYNIYMAGAMNSNGYYFRVLLAPMHLRP